MFAQLGIGSTAVVDECDLPSMEQKRQPTSVMLAPHRVLRTRRSALKTNINFFLSAARLSAPLSGEVRGSPGADRDEIGGENGEHEISHSSDCAGRSQ